MKDAESIAFRLHGPAEPIVPLVLDSPHSGIDFPRDMRSALEEFDLREAEDCLVDELYRPACDFGVNLIAARVPRTYIDLNRHAGDIDLELIEGGAWPNEYRPSGKAQIGKALLWRTLDDGTSIYRRKLSVAEVERRIELYHRPYHEAVSRRIDATHERFGASWHINCHSMNSVAGAQGEGDAGTERADFVVGDRDGTTCEPGFTELVRYTLAVLGYDVAVNDPFKGVELVRAYSDPAQRKMSLQLEINKRLYLDESTRTMHSGIWQLQKHLMHLIQKVLGYCIAELRR